MGVRAWVASLRTHTDSALDKQPPPSPPQANRQGIQGTPYDFVSCPGLTKAGTCNMVPQKQNLKNARGSGFEQCIASLNSAVILMTQQITREQNAMKPERENRK